MSKTLLFTSPACGPCKQLKMDLAGLGVDSEVTQVDVSQPENASMLAMYGVRSVPTLVFFDDDEEVIKTRVGYSGNPKDLQEMFV